MGHVKSMVRRQRLSVNPIVIKELMSRMRGVRAFALLTGVLLLLAGVSYTLYRIVLATTRHPIASIGPEVGQTLFVGLTLVELLMICLVTPAITAGAVSGERERLTLELHEQEPSACTVVPSPERCVKRSLGHYCFWRI
jgi:hypothetical protein